MRVVGKLLWENECAHKHSNSLPDDFESFMTVLKTTKGVLGADVINHGYAASIITLVIQNVSYN